MLSQLLVLFGFFSLVLVSVYWINRAVKLFDALIGDGQTAWVFAEFTALTLPNVIRLVLPMAAFAATVYVTNRLSSESELTVMQATGFSPWRLARPVLTFGILVGVMMAMLTHFLVPASLSQLRQRQIEISRNVTTRLLTEGTFLHPSKGVTFYIREITAEGALNDVFLSDRRNEDENVTYTANQAYLVRQDSGPKLIMVDGLSQAYDRKTGRLFTTHFSDFSYDISALINVGDEKKPHIRFFLTSELLRDPARAAVLSGVQTGRVIEEIHGRFNQPLLCVVAALIGFSTLLVGGFSRFGVWRQITAAFVLLVLVKFIEGVVADPVRDNPDLWPLVYAPSAAGFVCSVVLLAWAARTRRQRKPRKFAPKMGAVT